MPDPTTEARPNPLAAPENSWSAQVAAAEAKVAAIEAEQAKTKGPAEDKPKPFDGAPERDDRGKFVKAAPKAAEIEVDTETEQEEKPAVKDDGAEETDDDEDKRAQLQAIAKELGLRVDDRGVTKRERAEFRDWKRDQRERIAAAGRQVMEKEAQLQRYAEPLLPAIKAVQEGDYDAAMRELGRLVRDEELEREGLNGATKKYLRRAQGEDPRVDQLLRERKDWERREAERQRQEAEHGARQQQEREQQQHMHRVSIELAEAEDARVASLAANPAFVQQVFAVQQREWDGAETVTAAEAADEVLRGLQKTYRLLDSVFGGRDTLNPEDSDRSGDPSEVQRPKRRAPRPLKKGEAAEASRPAPVSTDPLKWRDKWAREIGRST